ncbi:hypothetical protein K9O30_08385 [Clostridium bowmanii]|uniref:hypothetical protein n=1 Tax=Clostridium bowmanii TaxID=132925 RepID=UPI001C0BE0FD|nr:hypothetical protein [Clostridium bowmanii]MBU3188855.1 hypothetical protein [Clostridium bowmanii]MCA1073739.1 hypothetical protein [Clostridium bowmanii]
MELDNFEGLINKINGVISTKIIQQDNEIQELHIMASTLRAPKQIVRDIESILLTSFDYRIDRKVISIAQIETDECDPIKRIKFGGISLDVQANMLECKVKLLYEEQEFYVTQIGIKTAANRKKIVAKATIDAVEKIIGQAYIFDVQDVLSTTNREVTFVSVLVNMVINELEETMVGSAIVTNDINEAIAKATLAAINRRILKNTFQQQLKLLKSH